MEGHTMSSTSVANNSAGSHLPNYFSVKRFLCPVQKEEQPQAKRVKKEQRKTGHKKREIPRRESDFALQQQLSPLYYPHSIVDTQTSVCNAQTAKFVPSNGCTNDDDSDSDDGITVTIGHVKTFEEVMNNTCVSFGELTLY